MNPAIRHPQCFDNSRAQRAESLDEPASQSFLEPRGEGILFAVICVIASTLLYAGVVMFRLMQV